MFWMELQNHFLSNHHAMPITTASIHARRESLHLTHY
ncbi:predicted protein [Plenodomus lingam JN3]|uniref:Predicted protein n=1 Tax=Leptosphaeria maculans (strain JN3 / isolate v23.1.3 / race Av1-4-5-6-7-8) TaxID=985895 RepID=E4ZMA6_LEPMJ|nr:predicted protein [Plenodomus lingam JN3]CBX92455.1 predicted protein [Plenodomus lingam JN3]